jgi:hypothetical protein
LISERFEILLSWALSIQLPASEGITREVDIWFETYLEK